MGCYRELFICESLNLSYLQGFEYVFVMDFYENIRPRTHIFCIPSINEDVSATSIKEDVSNAFSKSSR